jgi:Domain of unknown function (DUF222)
MTADPINYGASGAPAAAAGEAFAAGFLPRLSASRSPAGSGFESGGALDACRPDGSLAGLTDAVTRDGGLTAVTDDELIGVLRAWHRLESWCSAGALAAIAELARRRPAERTAVPPPGSFPAQLSEFIADEVAAALAWTARAADVRLELALDLATRLPGTARALHEGAIDYPKARLIADLTRMLTAEHAAEVEARILSKAGQQTTGQLRAAVSRAVLAVDADAAVRRREATQKDPRVRRWREDAGTGALAGYGLPAGDVLRADQRITDRALALRDAGLPGTLEELRARVYLDTLLGQDSVPSAGPDQPSPGSGWPPSGNTAASGPDDHAPDHRRRLASGVTLTVPLLTQLGLAEEPGNVAGFGPVDPALCRELISLAAAHPASRFCVTVTDADGRAIGHGCGPGRPSDTGPPGEPSFTVKVTSLAAGDCGHRHQEVAYQPSRKLRHLVWARNPTCCAPGCQRPAAQCDLDHTVPYDQGGRTCECGLAPLCRHHHRCKQSQGWRLDQPSPGTLRWTTPAGRSYRTVPEGPPGRTVPETPTRQTELPAHRTELPDR